jgi:hypothetical protein
MVGLTQPAGEMETRMPDDEGNLLMICNDGHCKLKHGLDDQSVENRHPDGRATQCEKRNGPE